MDNKHPLATNFEPEGVARDVKNNLWVGTQLGSTR